MEGGTEFGNNHQSKNRIVLNIIIFMIQVLLTSIAGNFREAKYSWFCG